MVVSDRIVIMRSGKIEQVGTPKEIYIRPKTIFTANFIGEANFMEGCIDKVKKNFSLVDIGEKIKVFSTEFEENEPVVIAIRPENILLKPRWINGCNALHGVVDDVIFLGEKTRYEIKVGDKRLVVKASETKKLKKGEKVTTFLNPKSILIYKYPSAGLRGELKLE
jgi:ABC-type Fe3+/spermidine/putrescine transport system ATPase subunit